MALLSAAISVLACTVTQAADYLLTASGPLSSVSSFSDTFDGTNHGTLPPHLNNDLLAGGSFVASFRFSTAVADSDFSPTTAYYDLAGMSVGLTYNLLDANGQVVHHGSDFFAEDAYVANNTGGAPYIVDQVLIGALVNATTNIQAPSPLYSASPEVFSVANVSCYSYVDANTNFLSDTQIPADASTYLAFPNKVFTAYNFFGDGDTANMIQPYQYLEDFAEYNITSLTVTQVPEPGSLTSGAVGLLLASIRSQKRRGSRTRRVVQACEPLEARRLLAYGVPVFTSLPGAPETLYLDFDGEPH